MSDETLDALFEGRLELFQSRRGYRFSLDAVLLAHFVALKPAESVADLGTGSGVIPLLLAALHADIAITGIEFQPAMAQRAEKNVRLNRLTGRIRICRGDVRAIGEIASSGSFDVVVCNPPYRKRGSGRISANDEKRTARHELQGDLGDFLAAGRFLLRAKGRAALVYPAERAADLICAMRDAGIEPKRLRTVHSFADAEASLVLVEGVKGGKPGAAIHPPLAVYRRVKEYTDEVSAMITGRALPPSGAPPRRLPLDHPQVFRPRPE
jgi:tRNA1Val (adenine37-N6)-methyltransferase